MKKSQKLIVENKNVHPDYQNMVSFCNQGREMFYTDGKFIKVWDKAVPGEFYPVQSGNTYDVRKLKAGIFEPESNDFVKLMYSEVPERNEAIVFHHNELNSQLKFLSNFKDPDKYNTSTPSLGFCIYWRERKIQACSGFKMVSIPVEINPFIANFPEKSIVPWSALEVIQSLLVSKDTKLTFSFEKDDFQTLWVNNYDTTVSIKLIDARYPDLSRVYPKEYFSQQFFSDSIYKEKKSIESLMKLKKDHLMFGLKKDESDDSLYYYVEDMQEGKILKEWRVKLFNMESKEPYQQYISHKFFFEVIEYAEKHGTQITMNLVSKKGYPFWFKVGKIDILIMPTTYKG